MRVALAQLNSVNHIATNLLEIEKLIFECAGLQASERPQIIFFPENSLFFRIDDAENIQALKINDQVFQKLQKLSQSSMICLHLTTAIEDGDQIWNASVLIAPGKDIQILYKKIHLFDIALEGQSPIRESDVFSAGQSTSIFEVDGVTFGSSICYDIRFSELYSQYAKAEVDVILVPAAFLVKTGIAHWEILLRARAIESQAYVLASAQSGRHQSTSSKQYRETYGHTMAIGPWGDVVGLSQSKSGLLFVDINTEKCHQVRTQIPMKNHRQL